MSSPALYLVYEHRLNGELIYIGCTSDALRPYDFCSRNRLWKAVVGQQKPDVRVLSRHRDKTAAMKRELQLISRRKPICNLWRSHVGYWWNARPIDHLLFGDQKQEHEYWNSYRGKNGPNALVRNGTAAQAG